MMPESSRDNSTREQSKARSRLMGERERSASHVSDESHVPLAKTGMKKTVQFHGGFTVILSETFDESGKSAGTAHDANISGKKRALGTASSRAFAESIREIAKPRKPPNTRQDLLPRRETVAQVGEFSLKLV